VIPPDPRSGEGGWEGEGEDGRGGEGREERIERVKGKRSTGKIHSSF
jgi:hypothetical protein